ncbi:hypothetical protein G195_000643 [Phytophthora kernoviae 00238/432]|uniref:Elongation factor Ts, mitochondrial n=1 Tax=Phytophthora kernoviae 00238/432 TaxID=1284355 RepID=A0A8J4SPT4_9STRA|nr:hypothetical protein G195_000643 [Phytophthora kernoviae 00238/432]
MLDCKKALEEANGDITKAAELLREKGLSAAASKAGRAATEGVVESYIHAGGRIGVLVEVNCETDFVGKTDQFKDFVKDIAMQIAAASPKFVTREEVPTEELDPDKTISQLLNEKVSQIGENISIRRFVRYELGEGLEKKVDNFVEEVMSQVNK